LVDELDFDAFKTEWEQVKKTVYSMRSAKPSEKIIITWTRIPIDILSEEENVGFSNNLRNCHEFVKTVSDLGYIANRKEWKTQKAILECAQELWTRTKDYDKEQTLITLGEEFYCGSADDYYSDDFKKGIQDQLFISAPEKDKVGKTLEYLKEKGC
jgi:hypothetical protein